MANATYRLFFNHIPASREQLDRVAEITVEQEVDMAWEAHIRMPIHTDDRGIWTGEDEAFMADFIPVRVEVRVGEGDFVPLLDGPLVGIEHHLSSEPGQSQMTLRVQDDSVWLNRDDRLFCFENLLDHEIASQLFAEAAQIVSTDIDKTPAPTSPLTPVVVQRGTAMQLLRSLARRQGLHAYLLPGAKPGQSVGCFKAFPMQPDGLPPLIVVGSDRNVAELAPSYDAQKPTRMTAYALSITDKSLTRRTAEFGNLNRLGQETTFQTEAQTGSQVMYPEYGDSVDLDQWVTAETLRSSYAFQARGKVLDRYYTGVLSPYRVVTVTGANHRLSGDYLITHVTHTLSHSRYSQSFTLQRNARSQGANTGLANLVEKIF